MDATNTPVTSAVFTDSCICICVFVYLRLHGTGLPPGRQSPEHCSQPAPALKAATRAGPRAAPQLPPPFESGDFFSICVFVSSYLHLYFAARAPNAHCTTSYNLPLPHLNFIYLVSVFVFVYLLYLDIYQTHCISTLLSI